MAALKTELFLYLLFVIVLQESTGTTKSGLRKLSLNLGSIAIHCSDKKLCIVHF